MGFTVTRLIAIGVLLWAALLSMCIVAFVLPPFVPFYDEDPERWVFRMVAWVALIAAFCVFWFGWLLSEDGGE